MGQTETLAYLSFRLDRELFALDLLQVREVIDFIPPARVPLAAEYLCGVINIRGGIVPVLDVKRRLGMGATVQTLSTCIIVSEVTWQGTNFPVGALADTVEEVMDMEPQSTEAPPDTGTGLNRRFLRGIGQRGEEMVILLDFEAIIQSLEGPLQAMLRSGKGADYAHA